MGGLTSVLRGVASRAGTSTMILVVALVAAGAAATGPVYDAASRTSILHDTLAGVPVTGRGFEVIASGGVSGTVDPLAAQIDGILAAHLGGGGRQHRLFQPPVEALETTAYFKALQSVIPLVWRSDVCAHLAIQGACPDRTHQVMVSTSLARINHWHLGQRLAFPTWGTLTVTGLYSAPTVAGDYWYDRGTTYFPDEQRAASSLDASSLDAMFVPRAALELAGSSAQGNAVVAGLLADDRVGQRDVAGLSNALTELVLDPGLIAQQAVVSSEIPNTLDAVRTGWTSLAVPVVLITAQLLVLAWLLLFLVVTDAVEARGPEIALAKLRGQGRWRTAVFGLSEPVTLVALALPAGALVSWGATWWLAKVLLRPGTPVGLPVLGWAAAAAATGGGFAAVGLAARRTLGRPVVEQWRRAGRRAAERGWVIDAVLLAAAATGLLEVVVTGQVTSAGTRVLSLLVPGLLGLTVAVVSSRLLPLACRVAVSRTLRFTSIAGYLALRHVARRPGGTRTTILLATSFALATFAVASWLVGHSNDRLVAGTEVGAPTVLTVATAPGRDLGAIVERADPGGQRAVAVEEYSDGQATTIGVDPARFARVATWHTAFSTTPLPALAAAIDPPAPPPVILAGDAVRMIVTVGSLRPIGTALTAEVISTDSTSTPVDFGVLPTTGRVTVTADLPLCPCTMQDLALVLPAHLTVTATLTFSGLQEHGRRGWAPVAAGFDRVSHWRSVAPLGPSESLSAGPAGLRWAFHRAGTDAPATPSLLSVDRPSSLPAIASAALVAGTVGALPDPSFGNRAIPIHVVAIVGAVPGAPTNGILVNRRYAELAAAGGVSALTEQVWLRAGAEAQIRPRLVAAGLRVLSAQHESSATATLERQGPGLASVLFLADAAAAAAIAAGGAIAGLYLYARRRSYEYAALSSIGVSRRTLLASLLAEQIIVLGFGAAVGIVAGLAAVRLALRAVPELITVPSAPRLSYVPAAGPLAAILAALVTLLLLSAFGASATFMRAVRPDQLREAPA